jgi:hypothetical protein
MTPQERTAYPDTPPSELRALARRYPVAFAGEATEPWTGKCRASTSTSTLHQPKRDGNCYVRAAAQNRLDDPGWEFRPEAISRSMNI